MAKLTGLEKEAGPSVISVKFLDCQYRRVGCSFGHVIQYARAGTALGRSCERGSGLGSDLQRLWKCRRLADCGFFRELSAAYLSAKFVLTIRGPESWARSFS